MPKNIDGARFVEKGDTIVMKVKPPADFVMDDKELLVQIDTLEQAITKEEDKVKKLKQNIKNSEDFIKHNSLRLKELSKFEPKMRVIQESKAKLIFEEIKAECKELVEKEYKTDDALTTDMNNKQRWRIYQQKIATHEKAAEQLAPKVINKFYFKEHILDNPWK